MHAGSVSRHWRKCTRFSVRALLALVVLIGAGLSVIVRSARTQREAVAEIQKATGIAFYDWEWRDGHDILGGEPWAPRWIVDLIGVDYFGHVTHVCLLSPSIPSDTTIVQVGHLTQLQRLFLFRSSLSDTGLAHLAGLNELSHLSLGGSMVTDAGLLHLKGLTKLSVLNLHDTQVTDAGLQHLNGMTNLGELDVRNTRVTDAGVDALKQSLPKLIIVH